MDYVRQQELHLRSQLQQIKGAEHRAANLAGEAAMLTTALGKGFQTVVEPRHIKGQADRARITAMQLKQLADIYQAQAQGGSKGGLDPRLGSLWHETKNRSAALAKSVDKSAAKLEAACNTINHRMYEDPLRHGAGAALGGGAEELQHFFHLLEHINTAIEGLEMFLHKVLGSHHH
jgi:hypothetical protein